ncbi:MAG: bifunctional hydroxymethylpyrimidine kinase/phosphomethylpyrimidine kinase [Elusimicrobia bacterium]|nr:bifunctional hydroxymethylpyrimidine kinase/phosphomethylpyrimidine kinase [Elusimicrobiota bacterium]
MNEVRLSCPTLPYGRVSSTRQDRPPVPRVLTIAGSDSGGGAGIQADLKTFAALKVYGMSVVTAITAQNTRGVLAAMDMPPQLIVKQFEAVADDLGVDAVKTGMLSNAAIVETVSAILTRCRFHNLVIDPVMVAKGGSVLLKIDAREALIKRLLPLAGIVTPNLPEAEALIGRRIIGAAAMRAAARSIVAFGPRAVLLKGGHTRGARCKDILFDRVRFLTLDGPRINSRHTHGTGCTLSAALAAYLALGLNLREAALRAKDYVAGAICAAPGLGSGCGPILHHWNAP